MFFSSGKIPRTINLPFNWVADYFDGTFLSEYDLETHKENKFYSIKKSNVIRFGLFGQNMKFFYEAIDGSFNINGKRIEINFEEENGKVHYLTNNHNIKDIITYKEAYTDFNNQQIIQKSTTTSVNFGYKTIYSNDDLILNFQPVVSLPFNNSAFITVKITSNKEMKGKLKFYCNGRFIEEFYIELEESLSGQMNWTIKY